MQWTSRESEIALVVGAVLAVGVLATPALAHVPAFGADNDDPGNATYVDDPAKSWSFYDRLEANESAYYRTYLEASDRLLVNTVTPRGGGSGAASAQRTSPSFDPGFVLMSPALDGTTGVPSHVEVPEGYGARVVEPSGEPRGTFEPFTPAALYRHAELDTTVDTSGTYYVAAYDRNGDPGNVGVVVGHTESFGIVEYASVPFDRPRIHRWEGQSPWLVYGPFLAGFVATLAEYRRRTRDPESAEEPSPEGSTPVEPTPEAVTPEEPTPRNQSRGEPTPPSLRGSVLAVAGGLYAATGVAVAVQTLVAVSLVGVTASLLVTLAFLAIPLGLAWTLLGLATGSSPLGRRDRGVLVVVALLGILTWAGFVLGPVLVAFVALLGD